MQHSTADILSFFLCCPASFWHDRSFSCFRFSNRTTIIILQNPLTIQLGMLVSITPYFSVISCKGTVPCKYSWTALSFSFGNSFLISAQIFEVERNGFVIEATPGIYTISGRKIYFAPQLILSVLRSRPPLRAPYTRSVRKVRRRWCIRSIRYLRQQRNQGSPR